MPYTVRKLPGKDRYRVTNRRTGRILARCTSKLHARKQVRLLYAIDRNPRFRRTRHNSIKKNNKKKKKKKKKK